MFCIRIMFVYKKMLYEWFRNMLFVYDWSSITYLNHVSFLFATMFSFPQWFLYNSIHASLNISRNFQITSHACITKNKTHLLRNNFSQEKEKQKIMILKFKKKSWFLKTGWTGWYPGVLVWIFNVSDFNKIFIIRRGKKTAANEF